ncbi:MAG TPA: hypothetical protein VFT67_10860 [Jatrophihabitantaceae bacterium]|nr:hypothetical protein [Jatrophihabitantaceae bacterium]
MAADADGWAIRDQLRKELRALLGSGLFYAMPTPGSADLDPPVSIHLKPSGVAVAARLYEQFGDYLDLQVGALPYPPGTGDLRAPTQDAAGERVTIDPAQLRCELDGPLSVLSGETIEHGLLLTNHYDRAVAVYTNGHVTASIVDPTNADVVGGFVGPQHLPLVQFTAAPGETVRVPLLVGTASFTSRLGFAVPPGQWQLVAPLDLDDGRRLITPALDLTVTA